jgi:deoxyhypusine synthase
MQAVLIPNNTIPDTPIIKGYEFSQGSDLDGIMNAMLTSGFQATALGQAVNEINRMASISSSTFACLIALCIILAMRTCDVQWHHALRPAEDTMWCHAAGVEAV